MTTGQCACGVLKYSFSSEPVISVLCHCSGCKRASSSDYTNNLIIPVDAFQMTSGTAKMYTSKGGSGKGCSKYFCEECGTMLYIDSEITPGLVILKAGTLDDLSLNETKYKPAAEIFCENKYNWLPNVEGVEQFNGAMGT